MKVIVALMFVALSANAATLRFRRTPPLQEAVINAQDAQQQQADILAAEKKNLEQAKNEVEATQKVASQQGPITLPAGAQVAVPVPNPAGPADIRANADAVLENQKRQQDAARINEHTKTNNEIVAEQLALRNKLLAEQANERANFPNDTDLPRRQAEALREFDERNARLNQQLVNAQVQERTNANVAIDRQREAIDRSAGFQ
ncbi:hypothetical protein M3Y95_00542200 [Aphelenchoides besseyi]|nr:hypothetical protein M3Y95_00542200 [Aphelenchoides besseyi]